LIGLEKVISQELITEVLRVTGRVNGRQCKLPHPVMLWIVLAMGLVTHLPIRQVFRFARRWTGAQDVPCRSALAGGRKRLGLEPLIELFARLAKPLATPNTPGAFYRGWRLMAIDGTTYDVPDSEANAVFGRSAGGRGAAAFPQVRKVSLVEVGTHVEVGLAIGGWSDSEKSLAQQLYANIPEDALLIRDRGFFSYDDWKALESKHKLLIRVQKHMILKPIKHLSDGTSLAKLYRCSDDRKYDRRGILVRVIEYTLDDPQRTGHAERHRLITNLLDAEMYPALELVHVYHERWEQELVFDEQKTHQDPRRAEKPTHLRSESPEGVRQELYALSLAHYVIRKLMFESAQQVGLDPDRLSFTSCFRILQSRLPECLSRNPRQLQIWYQNLLDEMRQETLPPRRNRVNPRVIKRKMSKWNKKRPHHRKLPPLQKTFTEAVVIET
jgi:hypothetical protein